MLMCFLQPGVMPRQGFQDLLDRKIFGVAMELIEDRPGNAPILRAMSEIAGPMSIQIAAHLLLSSSGGRGVLLGGAPGIPPAAVVILGAGAVGTTAARAALGNGAQVVVLDRDLNRLRQIDSRFGPAVTTMFADTRNVGRASAFADVMIGAAAIRGDRTPMVVTDEMVREMRPGSVILDLSIDQGGCVEGIRPTSIAEPTYIRHDVVHYAVANMPANVARTSTYALTNVALPYVREIAAHGLEAACAADHGLRRGFVTASGKCLRPRLAERFGVRFADVTELASEDWTTA
jgi:alanine dehydrogenase